MAHRISDWTFLTNHAHVLLCVARDPGIRHRDVAERVGITERAAQRIIGDLIESGYLERIEDHCRVADLLGLIPSSDARYSEKPGPGSN